MNEAIRARVRRERREVEGALGIAVPEYRDAIVNGHKLFYTPEDIVVTALEPERGYVSLLLDSGYVRHHDSTKDKTVSVDEKIAVEYLRTGDSGAFIKREVVEMTPVGEQPFIHNVRVGYIQGGEQTSYEMQFIKGQGRGLVIESSRVGTRKSWTMAVSRYSWVDEGAKGRWVMMSFDFASPQELVHFVRHGSVKVPALTYHLFTKDETVDYNRRLEEKHFSITRPEPSRTHKVGELWEIPGDRYSADWLSGYRFQVVFEDGLMKCRKYEQKGEDPILIGEYSIPRKIDLEKAAAELKKSQLQDIRLDELIPVRLMGKVSEEMN